MSAEHEPASGSPRDLELAAGRPSPPSLPILLSLAMLTVVSLGLHLWGIAGDLPYVQNPDEPIFIDAAVRMVQGRTLDPAWFGNPGSTVIYPAAAFIEIWFQLAKHLPFVSHPTAGIAATFNTDPTPFYMIGRLISAGYGVASVVVTWLVARRIIGDVGGLIAAALLCVNPLAIEFGQLVRTDTAGMFFALLTIWLILRAVDRERGVDWALAAISIGVAISTRYFFVTLVVPYVVGAWVARKRTRIAVDRSGPTPAPAVVAARALVLAPVAFAVSSPFALIDFHRTLVNLRTESRTVHPGADGLSPLGNLDWYLTVVLPTAIGYIALGVAVIGMLVLIRRAPAAALVIIAYVTSYLVGISASPLHWERYAIPLIPILGIFVSAAFLTFGRGVARRLRVEPQFLRRGIPSLNKLSLRLNMETGGLLVAAICMASLLVAPAARVAAADRLNAVPSTRVAATEWALSNLQGATVAEEAYGTYLAGADDRFHVVRLSDRSVESYRADGYDYLIVSSQSWSRYFDEPTRYGSQIAFYTSLTIKATLVMTFAPDNDRGGPRIDVYDIRQR